MSRITTIRRTRYDEPITNLNTYFGYRVKRPPPPLDNEDAPAGRLCWGSVGALPTAELPEETGFEVVDCDETHAEVSRETQDVRIENPESPQDWVEVERPDKFLMNKTEKKNSANNNTDTAEPDFGGFEATPIYREGFKPLGTEDQKKCKLTITIKNTQRAA
jgi:hypothetical protein